MSTAVLEDLTRSVPFTLARAGDGEPGDGLTLEGHAAVFGVRTWIDSWEGSFWEQIRAGAFKKTIRERTPVMQFDHGRHPLVGSIPIGRINDLREDNKGLYVKARLSDNWLIEPVRDAIRDEAVNGMSFRFSVVREEWRDAKGKIVKDEELMDLLWSPGDRGPLERTLIELRMPELGPVVFPAYVDTDVSVRARDVAEVLTGDERMRREVRRALASSRTAPAAGDLPTDPDLLREIAHAVLFSRSSDAPPEPGYPSEPPSTQDEPTDAPPAPGHPSTPDAPPDSGHPSLSDRDARLRYARLAYVTREGVGSRFK